MRESVREGGGVCSGKGVCSGSVGSSVAPCERAAHVHSGRRYATRWRATRADRLAGVDCVIAIIYRTLPLHLRPTHSCKDARKTCCGGDGDGDGDGGGGGEDRSTRGRRRRPVALVARALTGAAAATAAAAAGRRRRWWRRRKLCRRVQYG